MIKILANDGIHPAGQKALEDAGFQLSTEKVPQNDLLDTINSQEFNVVLVRSATKITREIIEGSKCLKLIGRGGVGLDNIDLVAAKEQNIEVINTPGASSKSVAELAISHLFTAARFLHASNHEMRQRGNVDFSNLKKSYSKGIELQGKTLGIIGFGEIGQATARLALGIGMDIKVYRRKPEICKLLIHIGLDKAARTIELDVEPTTLHDLFRQSDFISLHLPFKKGSPPIISTEEIKQMKSGVGLINTARGGAIDEQALLDGLNNGKIGFAGLDVFEDEPTPNGAILEHPSISLSPHIGGSTLEAQRRVGEELASKVVAFFN